MSANLGSLCVALLLLAAASTAGSPLRAQAATITVNSRADTSGDASICTLRDAITAANTNAATGGCAAGDPGMDTIDFNLGYLCLVTPCSIILTNHLPELTEDLTLDGGGFFPTINGNGVNVLGINGPSTVNVSNVRIANGSASNGGGINNLNGATLTVTNVTFGGNLSNDGNGNTDGGGAIKQWGGMLNVVNSTFSGNTAAKVGGAIQSINGSTVTVSGSTFANNTSTLSAGAIQQDGGGTLMVSNSTFSNNSAGYGGGISASPGTSLTLTNVTFTSNTVCMPMCVNGANGGAVYQPSGPLTAVNSTFDSNTANLGGAIYSGGGDTVISGTTFSGNQASIGGAIESVGGGTLDITGSLFDSNTAGLLPGGSSIGTGGAIATEVQTNISSSTFSRNHAQQCQMCGGAAGGALDMTALGQTLTISDTTFNNNVSDSDGGALQVLDNVTAMLANITLSGNTAQRNGGGILQVKGANYSSVLNLSNVTITANTADSNNAGTGHGGGVFQVADFLNNVGTINVQNSIIAGNFDTPNNAGGGTLSPDCSGTLTDNGYNLLGRDDGCSGLSNGTNGNQVGTGANPIDPHLGPLADNGGPTETCALLPGSPAIDAGNPLPVGSGGLACAATDQRGVARAQPGDSRCDIGAYEATTSTSLTTTSTSLTTTSTSLTMTTTTTTGTTTTLPGGCDLILLPDGSLAGVQCAVTTLQRTLLGPPQPDCARHCHCALQRPLGHLSTSLTALQLATTGKRCRQKLAAVRRAAKGFGVKVDALIKRHCLAPSTLVGVLQQETATLTTRAKALAQSRYCTGR
jgi:CSLREA domain-containing protein